MINYYVAGLNKYLLNLSDFNALPDSGTLSSSDSFFHSPACQKFPEQIK